MWVSGSQGTSRILAVVKFFSAALLVAVITVGCGGEEGQSPTTSAASAITATTTTQAVSPTTTNVPDYAYTLDGHISWVVSVLNGAETTTTEVADRFSLLLEQYVAPADFLLVVDRLRSTVSERWDETRRQDNGSGTELILDTDDGEWGMVISADREGLIDTLLFQPAMPQIEGPALESFDDLVGRLEASGRTSVLIADVTSGSCDPVFVHEDVVRPIGSDFKLYVLGALADAVARGDLAWEDTLAIDNDLKSLPSGTFQTRPEGSEATILEFAEAMIAASDNTATDHLIDLLTRAQVEDALVDYGNSDASLNLPFLTTQEFFGLKLAVSGTVAGAYAAGDEDERRALLAGEVAAASATVSDAVTWVMPYLIEGIEWFASPTSMCRAIVGLITRANVPDLAEVRSILSLNPGVLYDPNTWSYVGYKGGSEPGVLSLVWYLETPAGEAYAYVVNVSNPDEILPEAELAVLAGSAFDLIAEIAP